MLGDQNPVRMTFKKLGNLTLLGVHIDRPIKVKFCQKLAFSIQLIAFFQITVENTRKLLIINSTFVEVPKKGLVIKGVVICKVESNIFEVVRSKAIVVERTRQLVIENNKFGQVESGLLEYRNTSSVKITCNSRFGNETKCMEYGKGAKVEARKQLMNKEGDLKLSILLIILCIIIILIFIGFTSVKCTKIKKRMCIESAINHKTVQSSCDVESESLLVNEENESERNMSQTTECASYAAVEPSEFESFLDSESSKENVKGKEGRKKIQTTEIFNTHKRNNKISYVEYFSIKI